eukprot:scaffold391_cov350-Prasinococcus_capsulatus_cf.AAC.1
MAVRTMDGTALKGKVGVNRHSVTAVTVMHTMSAAAATWHEPCIQAGEAARAAAARPPARLS